jgi:hypothetical protein
VFVYPSVASARGQDFREFDAYVFDKLDGNNLRFEWSRKRSWFKHGTRERLFDETDRDFGGAVKLFQLTLAQSVEKIARDQRWQRLVLFAEYWGKQSLGGIHVPGDGMRLTVFDAVPDDRGLLDPRDFLKVFDHRALDPQAVAKFLGRVRWTRGFVASVREGKLDGVTFEGVVGKSTDGFMAKAKTSAWIDAVLRRHGEEVGRRIVES